MPTDMKLPELGENIEGGDVLRVMVKPGDAIKKDQPVLELETDKATIEVPSSADGVVTEIKVKPGEKVKVGQTIFVVDSQPAGNGDERAAAPQPAPAEEKPAPVAEPAKPEKRRAEVVEMNRPKPVAAPAPPQAEMAGTSGGASVPAAPAARRLARELNVAIQDVQGSGPGGRISMDDVTAYARRLLSGAGGARPATAAAPLPDFSHWGTVERKPMSGVRRTTAHR